MLLDVNLAKQIVANAISLPYRQTDATDTRGFSSWLKERDIDLDSFILNFLTNEGILRPILFIGRTLPINNRYQEVSLGHESKTYLDLGISIVELHELLISDFGQNSDDMIWHDFQLWRMDEIAKRLDLHLASEVFLGSHDSFISIAKKQLSEVSTQLIDFSNSAKNLEFEKVLCFLLAAEPLVISDLQNKITINEIELSQSLDGYFIWRDAFNYMTLMSELNIDVEFLKKWHKELAIKANLIDPIRNWRGLVRLAPRDKRLTLDGKALRAEEFYYQAEIIRRFLERYLGVNDLPEEDDVMHGPQGAQVKKRLFGSTRTYDGSKSVGLNIVRQFDLDQQPRLRWFVEGETEVGFVKEMASQRHFDLTKNGVEVINLNGLGGLNSDRTEIFLQISQSEEIFCIVCIDFDDQPANRNTLRKYASNKLLPAGFEVFEPNFVQANFLLNELAEIATEFANEHGAQCKITGTEISDEMAQRKLPAEKAIARVLSKNKVYDFAKGESWGRLLAKYASAHEPSGKARPIEDIFVRVARAQTSSYKFTVEKTIVNEGGKVVRKSENTQKE